MCGSFHSIHLIKRQIFSSFYLLIGSSRLNKVVPRILYLPSQWNLMYCMKNLLRIMFHWPRTSLCNNIHDYPGNFSVDQAGHELKRSACLCISSALINGLPPQLSSENDFYKFIILWHLPMCSSVKSLGINWILDAMRCISSCEEKNQLFTIAL